MKYDIDHFTRGYLSNLLRARATRQRSLASGRSMSATKLELETEAEFCEREAQRLDDALEPTVVSDKEPVRVTARRDLDSVDQPPASTATTE